MASIVPGYEYDIFISYRQKDNKGDKWVSEFVEALKTELESTFKEDISVYFDINPHDGLLATHDVKASLKEKLKCLVFIPIISRTYCDPKSFAWEHEFKAFVEQASQDQFGLKVKLPGGNVANRILPIQIHDLTSEDKTLLEKELGGVLRSIEFIYKEPGVDKPLAPEDNEKKNLNNTKYRIQIIKVAHAIKDIVLGLKTEHDPLVKGTPPLKEVLNEEKKEDSRKEVISKGIIDQKSKKRLIILVSVFLFITGAYAIYKIIDRSNQTQALTNLEKSIAVLPFINDSPSDSTTYFVNGIMDDILNNLQKIKAFSKVLPRTSVEQYRGSVKPTIPKIAKDLDVNYIVAGSGQKYGNYYRVRVQLIVGKTDKQLWGDSYEREIRGTHDIYGTQSEIAQSIASALKATITPEEKQLIEKIPTTNLTANNLYLRAKDYQKDYEKTRDPSSYQRAVNLYNAALEIDSTFAKAYVGLAWMYYYRYKYDYEAYFKENYLDSCLVLLNTALSFDDHLEEAYCAKGMVYYRVNGQTEVALKNLDKALKINPNYYLAYREKGNILRWFLYDYVESFRNSHKALTLISGDERPSLLRDIGEAYLDVGFVEKAKYYYKEAFDLDSNKVENLSHLTWLEYSKGNFEEALKLQNQQLEIDSTATIVTNIVLEAYSISPGHKEEAFLHAKKMAKYYKNTGVINTGQYHRIGYAYYQVGKKQEAESYFKQQIKIGEESIRLNRPIAQWKMAQYDLAATYAILGDKTKAYQYLDEVNTLIFYESWWISLAKNDPLFNSIRNEERFQKILQNMEAKHQAEHERVRKWLEDQGKL
jgi:TolB-like protein